MSQHRGVLDGDEVDADYKAYLTAQFKALHGDEEEIQEDCLNMENAKEGEEDEEDPQYMLFLKNLKPCGNAYVLEIARGNGKAKIVRYEDRDEDEFHSSDEPKRKVKAPSPVSRHSPRARWSKGLLFREMKNLEIGSDQSQGQRNGKQKTGIKDKSETPNCRRRSLRGSGKEFPVEIGRSDDLEEGKSRHQSRVGSRRNGEHLSKGGKDKGRVFKTPYNEEMDKAYYMFLTSLRVSGNSFIYTGKDGISAIYDESNDDESRSDSDTEGSPKRVPSSGRMTPEPGNKRPAPSEKSFNFRQGVMDILLKPYDKKEHVSLLKEAMHQKPVVRHKEMRSRCADFVDATTVGRSYLDHHGDLRRKIREIQHDDKPKVLHLLRGFFFYLQHICMEDQFKPWNDDSWLEAMNKATS